MSRNHTSEAQSPAIERNVEEDTSNMGMDYEPTLKTDEQRSIPWMFASRKPNKPRASQEGAKVVHIENERHTNTLKRDQQQATNAPREAISVKSN